MKTLVAVLFLVASAALAAPKPDLTGRIVDAAGKPVHDAHVYIYTAGPREGLSAVCPSCYPDCGKQTVASADGSFRIKALDPKLLFRVLAVADGYDAQFVPKVDPGKGPVTVKLARLEPGPPEKEVRGRVLDPKARAVAGATVTINAQRMHERKGVMFRDFGQVAVTNRNGEFVIRVPEPADQYDLLIKARNLAPRIEKKLATGADAHTITLTNGAAVAGRLVRNGKPVTGARVSFAQLSRNSEFFVGAEDVATDEGGRFVLTNLLPGEKYIVAPTMESLAPWAGAAVELKTGDDDSRTRLDDLALRRGHRVKGMVAFPGDIPPHTRIMLSRAKAWDFQSVELDGHCGFVFEGVPDEDVTLNVSVPGYQVLPDTAGYDLNWHEVILKVDKDLDDVVIRLGRQKTR